MADTKNLPGITPGSPPPPFGAQRVRTGVRPAGGLLPGVPVNTGPAILPVQPGMAPGISPRVVSDSVLMVNAMIKPGTESPRAAGNPNPVHQTPSALVDPSAAPSVIAREAHDQFPGSQSPEELRAEAELSARRSSTRR